MFGCSSGKQALFIFCVLLNFQRPDAASLEKKERTRRDTRYCTYSYVGTCEKVVIDTFRCASSRFFDCFRTETSSCYKYYVDCCEGFLMDDGACFAVDEACDDCFTLTDCDGKVEKLRTREGVISSKNYPQSYENGVDCTWTIRGGRNSTVVIEMKDFKLQPRRDSSQCYWDRHTNQPICKKICHDWVILEGVGQKLVTPVRECGIKNKFPKFETLGRTARVHFHSDSTISNTGFQLQFSILGGADPSTTSTTPTTATTSAADITTSSSTLTMVTTSATDKTEVSEDTKLCPDKLQWSPCPNCTRTCSNVGQSEEDCRIDFGQPNEDPMERCTPGCVCPEEYPIWHDLECVTSEACLRGAKLQNLNPCIQLGLIKGDCLRTCDNMDESEDTCILRTISSKSIGADFVCTCTSGKYMEEGKCVTREQCLSKLNERCTDGKVWSTCMLKCEQTCSQASSCTSRSPATPCVSGCICPREKPIYHKGKCVTADSCLADENIVCGKQHYEPILKIMGGDRAVKASWPWLVMLEKKVNGKYTLSCGGTLICEKWVLTASHCFLSATKKWLEKDRSKYRLHIGRHHKKYDLRDRATGMLANIVPLRIITHEKYSLFTHVNDIALVELPLKVNMSRYIRPACIHNVSDDFHPLAALGETCMSAGWGAETNKDKPINNPDPVLKQVELAARQHGLCSALFYNFNIETMHCVGGHRNRDTCAGDSGGPLMCMRKNRWYVDGVVSYGFKCGIQDQPGVYTRVPYYSEWIHKNAGSKCGDPSAVWASV